MILTGAAVSTAVKAAVSTIRPIVEYRGRFERRVDRDFSAANNDNRSDLLQRARVGAQWSDGKSLSALAQWQYTHDLAWAAPQNFSREHSDLFQAYLQQSRNGTVITAGRQLLKWGNDRFFSSSDWSEQARTYDIVRVQSGPWDGFAGKIGMAGPNKPFARIGAIMNTDRQGVSTFVYKHDKVGATQLDLYTVGRSLLGKLSGFDYELLAIGQFGHTGGRDSRAWAYVINAGRKLDASTSFKAEFAAASGGSPASGTNLTYDSLYTSNHGLYGIMAIQTLRNAEIFSLNLTRTLSPSQSLHLRACHNSLHDARDGWYGSSGINSGVSGAFQDPTGTSGRFLGNELDLDWTWKANDHQTCIFGLSAFVPGTFVKNLAGDNRTQWYGYAQFTWKL